jgi:hypothetical protein
MQSEGQILEDTINEAHLDGAYNGAQVTVYGGVGYSARTKTTTGFTEPNACAYCGSDVLVPSSVFSPTSYNFFGGAAGGNTANWVDYNAQNLFRHCTAVIFCRSFGTRPPAPRSRRRWRSVI